jgi:alkylhydroperoxidase/carboxymuconolactone decarboxylase family protein YurZ
MYNKQNLTKIEKLNIEIHTGNARKAGVTDTELTEAAMVAASLRAGGAVTHATHALSA